MVDDDNNGTWIISSTAEGAKEGHIGREVKALLHPQKRSKTTDALTGIENALIDAITPSALSPSYFFISPIICSTSTGACGKRAGVIQYPCHSLDTVRTGWTGAWTRTKVGIF